MANINLRVLSSAPVEALYELAHSAYDFVDAMPNIREIVLLEEAEDRRFSKAEWVLDVPIPASFGKLSWIKEVFWDDTVRKCDIRLSPDYRGVVTRLNGTWLFEPREGGTEMKMLMDFRVSHPLVGRRLHGMFESLMKKNIEKLMSAIKTKAESGCV